MRGAIILAALLALSACREETAPPPKAVTMTAAAVGFYCQMNVLEHGGPKGQIFLKDMPAPLFFSQVRDAIAYQRMPEQSHEIVAVYVSDMGAPGATWEQPGPDNWILADHAHYVTGSDLKGGMGATEMVPFASAEAAKTFATEHGGKVVALSDISDAEVLAPEDAPATPTTAPSAGDDYAARLRALGTVQKEQQP